MNDVNWWLMALSFVLGLLLTFAFMIRRVTREVPIYAPLGRGPKAATKKAAEPQKSAEPKKVAAAPQKPAAEAASAGVAAATAPLVTKVIKEEPYGAGSVRVSKSVAPPRAEFLVKGDEDTMQYFTVDSPDYEKLGAEVWFQDAESAERAGFRRWDVPGDHTVADSVGGTVETTETATSASVVGEPEAGPYGVGSANAGADGAGPVGWTIKGNADSMLYHTPASEAYEETIAEVWFADEATAEAAGFKKHQ